MRLAAFSALLALAATAATADPVADFYRGKTVTVVSPSGVGGSIYEYARLVSNHIGRHIPGQPTVIVEARDGGGGVRAANWVAGAAPKDGTIIAELHPSSMLIPVTRGRDAANYDASKFQYLGSVAVRSYVGAVWHATGITSLADMTKDRPVVFGGSGVGSPSYQNVMFVAHVTGANLSVLPGYESGGQTNLAMERGEVQGRGNFYEGFLATNPDWIRDGKVRFVFRMGPDHPDLAAVPHVRDMVKTDEQKAMLAVLEAPLAVGQSFYVAEGVPADRVAALRTAFEAMLADPAFLAEAQNANLEINPRSWQDVQAVLADVYAKTTPETAKALDAIFARK